MGPFPQAGRLVLIAAGVLALSCGGGGDDDGETPSAPSTPAPAASPSPPPPPLAASPFPDGQPGWIPPGTFECAIGPGHKDASCEAETQLFADAVNAAIDRVVAEQLDLFPDRNITSRVRDEEAIHVAVARILQAQGFCAGWDLIDLQVRNSNDFSERYDLFDRRGVLHLDPADRVRSTCRPADFPLSAADRIDFVRVAFFGIDCPAGVRKPPNTSGRMPLGCLGQVTATPKDRDFADVDPRVHGPFITWELHQTGFLVDVTDSEASPFNKSLRARNPGPFALCATVQGVHGCLDGEVTVN